MLCMRQWPNKNWGAIYKESALNITYDESTGKIYDWHVFDMGQNMRPHDRQSLNWSRQYLRKQHVGIWAAKGLLHIHFFQRNMLSLHSGSDMKYFYRHPNRVECGGFLVSWNKDWGWIHGVDDRCHHFHIRQYQRQMDESGQRVQFEQGTMFKFWLDGDRHGEWAAFVCYAEHRVQYQIRAYFEKKIERMRADPRVYQKECFCKSSHRCNWLIVYDSVFGDDKVCAQSKSISNYVLIIVHILGCLY